MARFNTTKSWSFAALLAVAGAIVATGGMASAAHPTGDDSDRKVIIRKLGEGHEWMAKAHSMGSWSDGEVEVSTTIEDGQIKVVVNGKVVYEGDISGVTDLDLGEIKLHKLDGALALFKDGHQVMRLGDGAKIVIGENGFDLSDLKGKLEGLKGLKGLKGLEWFGDGENSFHFDSEHLHELIEHARDSANTFHFDSEHLHELIAQAREGEGFKSFVFAPDGNFGIDKKKIQELIVKAQERAGEGRSWSFSTSDDDEHPGVMLGINIDTGDEIHAMLRKLDLDADDVTVVLRAIEGLPAAKAGIKGGDIIIKLNGSKGAGQTMLMELLGDKEPGEEIEIVVLRGGEPHELLVELEAFNPGKLGIAAKMRSFGRFAPDGNSFFSGEHQQHIAETAKRLAELAQKLEGASGKNREEITAELEAMGQKMAQMARDTARFRFDFDFDDMQNLHFSGEDGEGRKSFNLKMLPQIVIDKLEGGQRGFVIVSPDEDGEDIDVHIDTGDSDADRVEELEAKIRRLEKILERLSDNDDDSKGDV